MKKLHKSSGYAIETAVIFYDEIHKFSPGVVLINPEGMKTNRITSNPIMYSSKKEANEASFEIGKELLINHLSNSEILYFNQQ